MEQLASFGERALGMSAHDELARVLDRELRLVLRARVHKLHVTHGRVVARYELDMLIRRLAGVGLACRLAQRSRRIDDRERVDELAVLGQDERLRQRRLVGGVGPRR